MWYEELIQRAPASIDPSRQIRKADLFGCLQDHSSNSTIHPPPTFVLHRMRMVKTTRKKLPGSGGPITVPDNSFIRLSSSSSSLAHSEIMY